MHNFIYHVYRYIYFTEHAFHIMKLVLHIAQKRICFTQYSVQN